MNAEHKAKADAAIAAQPETATMAHLLAEIIALQERVEELEKKLKAK